MFKSLSLISAVAGISAFAFSSCAPMQPRVNVEETERQGQDIAPNLNHGQHEAGQNAVEYSTPHRRRYGDPYYRY